MLDLLSNLRLEAQLLNDDKTGPNTKKQKPAKPVAPSPFAVNRPDGVSETEHLQNLVKEK